VRSVHYPSAENILPYCIVYLDLKAYRLKIHKSIILFVVLCESETRFLLLRKEPRLRVSEDKVLGRIFGCERDEVMGELRMLHNEEFHNLYSVLHITGVIK